MILQHLHEETRLILQNDHALVSGEMARRWRGIDRAPEEPCLEAILAIALHDASWIPIDEEAPFNAKTGLPHDFMTLPVARKVEVYEKGIDRLETLQPYSALLLSLHYSAFVPEQDSPDFRRREQLRQERLRHRLQSRYRTSDITRDFALLRLLDVLSLRVCITPPGSDPATWPGWVTSPREWNGVELTTAWTSANSCTLSPFPFRERFDVTIPYVAVPRRREASDPTWKRRGEEGTRRTWVVRIEGG